MIIVKGEFYTGEIATADPNNIRKMKEEDLEQVKKIWLKEAINAHQRFIPETFWDSKQDDFIEETKKATERYVYQKEGDIHGFITAWPTSSETAYIAELYVDIPRQGIGTALFKTLKGENPKFLQLKERYEQFTSSFYAHNYVSIAWHIKNKFKITGIHFCQHTGLPKFDVIWKKENNYGT